MDARLFGRLVKLNRRSKRALLLSLDALGAMAALHLAVALDTETAMPTSLAEAPWLYGAVAVATTLLLAGIGFYRVVLRYGDAVIVGAAAKAALPVAVAAAILARLGGVAFSLTSAIILWGCLVVSLAAPRIIAIHRLSRVARRASSTRIPAAIYGAGQAGVTLLGAMRFSGPYEPRAFFDDDPTLRGRVIQGVTVHGPGAIASVIRDEGIQTVVLALPSVSRERRQAVVARLQGLPVRVQTVPSLGEWLVGRAPVQQIHDITAEDLLWRDPVAADNRLVESDVAGRVVMVTGGGGSIGSELCRQVFALGARRLVVVELSEPALYRIEMELGQRAQAERAAGRQAPALTFLLGNAVDGDFVRGVMQRFDVELVYHAAAYKHVPIVEGNPLAGIRNNAFGTLAVARAAMAAGVAKMVLVSTDKAVRPTNVMGASKRLAELVLQSLMAAGSSTCFTMVRFGNVLDSDGSVVPLFRRQIAEGGPVTLTHPDITRYFMTIPEAVGLVLQAGAMAEGGEVFVLDMGQPVRIRDLAERMIQLAGLTVRSADNPAGDIAIEVVGLRPGEKLHEELIIDAAVARTAHPKIMRAEEGFLPWSELDGLLHRLARAIEAEDDRATLSLLKQAVAEYAPAGQPDAGRAKDLAVAAQ